MEKLFNLSAYEFDFILREVLNKTYSDYLINGLKNEEFEKIKPFIEMAKYKPVEYIFNKAFFRNLELYVNENVLIPRNETEQLVIIAIKIIKERNYYKIFEIGIGSGAISISLAKEIDKIKIFANDISFKALKIAKKNIKKYQAENKIFLFCGNSIKSIKSKFHLIIWNVPYVFEDEYVYLSEKVKVEPKLALLYNDEVFTYFLNNFKNFLLDNGSCILEISPRLIKKLKNYGFKFLKDFQDIERFAIFSF
jgi:release factor glutamine methyltransferase